MITFTQSKLLSCEKNSFVGANGDNVVFFKNYLKGVIDDTGVIEVNSKADFTALEGKDGVAKIKIFTGEKIKLSLVGFYPGEVIPSEEFGEIL